MPSDAIASSALDINGQWATCGLLPDEARVAEAMGFRPVDIIGLRRATPTELDWPAIERRLHATVASIRARATQRPFDNWVKHGGSMADAVAWLDAGLNLSAAAQWRRCGFMTPEQAAPWRQQEFDSEPAAQWRDSGVDDPRLARSLIRRRIQGGDLAALVKHGVPSDAAQAWLVAKFRVMEIPGWHHLGLTIDQVSLLGEARMIGPERAGKLLERGVPFAVIPTLKTLTGRTWIQIRTGAISVDDIVALVIDAGLVSPSSESAQVLPP